MADFTLNSKTLETTVDRAADDFLMYDSSAAGLRRTRVNNMLNIVGDPVGTTDMQTLTSKTLTSPTVSSPILSGTVVGTYTLGGTPTFPAAVVTLTGSQTLTNKVLTSPTINTATIANPTLTTDTVSEFTTANGVTIDGLNIKDGALTTANSTPVGTIVQVVNTNFTAVSSGTTTIPHDDTIPQNGEGVEFMTQAITPKSTSNTLILSVTLMCAYSVASFLTVALFQDSTANALAAVDEYIGDNTGTTTLHLQHSLTAGTVSSTTFKIRAGGGSAGTIAFNGAGAGQRLFGAITKSNITIYEVKA